MNDFTSKVMTGLVNVAQNTHVSFSLDGTPAAVAVGLAGFFGTASYALYQWGKHDERKMMQNYPQPLDEQLYHQLMGYKVPPKTEE